MSYAIRPEPASETGLSTDPALVHFLASPQAYACHPARVEVRQTHISWVFLTDRHAYKLKKPVRFDFLDYSTPQLRRAMCEREVELNRRLAADVYVGVVPILRSPRLGYQLGERPGVGECVDWLVKMRRLPDEAALDRRIADGQTDASAVARLATRLSAFYRDLPPVTISGDEYWRRTHEHVRGNLHDLLKHAPSVDASCVRRVHTAQLRLMVLRPDLFHTRALDGRIVDGHGDLRPEHVYLLPEPTIIDCIEFNDEFRHVDVVDELGFLAMECSVRQAAWIGEKIMERYLAESFDRPPAALVAFYACYRACVRAKVELLRSDQLAGREALLAQERSREYLTFAAECAARLGPPGVIVVRGPSGVGKSTIAKRMAEEFAALWLRTDTIRQQLFGPSTGPRPYDAERYAPENRQRVYDEMFHQAAEELQRGLTIVLDGTFLSADLQQRVVDLAHRYGAVPFFVNCNCPTTVAAERMAERAALGDRLSDAQLATHVRQRQEQTLPPPHVPQVRIDTRQSLPGCLGQIFAKLAELYDQEA